MSIAQLCFLAAVVLFISAGFVPETPAAMIGLALLAAGMFCESRDTEHPGEEEDSE